MTLLFRAINVIILIYLSCEVKGQTCDTYDTLAGGITTPGYPGDYPPNMDYCMTFDTGHPTAIEISQFSMAPNDYVTFYYGPAVDPGMVMWELTGTISAPVALITLPFDTRFTVLVVSDGTTSTSGMSAEFTALGVTIPPPRETSVDIQTSADVPTTRLEGSTEAFAATEVPTEVPNVQTTDAFSHIVHGSTTPEFIDLCDRGILAELAPRLESLIIDDSDTLYLVMSSMMEHNGDVFITRHTFEEIDLSQDTTFQFDDTMVIYNASLVQVTGSVEHRTGMFMALANVVLRGGGGATGTIQPINISGVISSDRGAFESKLYQLLDGSVVEFEGNSEVFPWYVPASCNIEDKIVTEDDDFPWLYVYIAIGVAMTIPLGALGIYLYYTFCRKNRKIEPTATPDS